MAKKNRRLSRSIGVWVVIGVVGLLIIRQFVGKPSIEAEAAVTSRPIGNSAVISVEAKSNSDVVLTKVNINQVGYVAVYQDEVGKPVQLLGSSPLIRPGDDQTVTATMARPAKMGENLYVVIFYDDGDAQFRLETDGPLQREDGTMVMAKHRVRL